MKDGLVIILFSFWFSLFNCVLNNSAYSVHAQIRKKAEGKHNHNNIRLFANAWSSVFETYQVCYRRRTQGKPFMNIPKKAFPRRLLMLIAVCCSEIYKN